MKNLLNDLRYALRGFARNPVFTAVAPPVGASSPPSVTVWAKDLPALKPHLLAGDRRRVVVPRPAGLPPGPVRVTVSD